MSLVPANFTLESFAALLRSESRRCIRVAVQKKWLPPLPEALQYYFPLAHHRFVFNDDHSEVTVAAETLLPKEELLPHLFREEDGHFRSEILLSPFAITETATVVEVALRDPNWTNQIITGKYAFPHEPFQLRGPALPASWKHGEPIPMVSLPRLRTESADHQLEATPKETLPQG